MSKGTPTSPGTLFQTKRRQAAGSESSSKLLHSKEQLPTTEDTNPVLFPIAPASAQPAAKKTIAS
jgi:hypothetical protein